MSTARRSVRIRRSVDEVAKVATDPAVVMPIVGGFGRCAHISAGADGTQEWELFLIVGTIHVGGRVLVQTPSHDVMVWHSLRGTRHQARIEVAETDGGAMVTMSITPEFAGTLTGPLTGLLARGILDRYIEAGLQQLRHHIEFGG